MPAIERLFPIYVQRHMCAYEHASVGLLWICMCVSLLVRQKAIYLAVHQISLVTRVISFRKWQWPCGLVCVEVCVVIACDITTLISYLVIVGLLWTARLNNEKELKLWGRVCQHVWERTLSACVLNILFPKNFQIVIVHGDASNLTIQLPW